MTGQPTPRELEVLAAFIRHRSRKCAAAELGITDQTASVHMRRLYRRLGVHSREEAAALLGPEPVATPPPAKKPRSKREESRRERLQRLRRYGLSSEEFDRLERLSGGRCMICGQKPDEESLHIDHDHATGAVRGLLCRDCNFMLGYGKDNPERLLRGADYLGIPQDKLG